MGVEGLCAPLGDPSVITRLNGLSLWQLAIAAQQHLQAVAPVRRLSWLGL